METFSNFPPGETFSLVKIWVAKLKLRPTFPFLTEDDEWKELK